MNEEIKTEKVNELSKAPGKRGRPKGTKTAYPLATANKQVMTEYDPAVLQNFLINLSKVGREQKPDPKDPQALEDRIEDYFNACAELHIKPNPSHLAMALGTSRTTMMNWANDHSRYIIRQEVIENALNMIEALTTAEMQYGGINPVSGIFLLKNWSGYKNETEVTVQATTLGLPVESSAEEIAQNYIDSVPDDE